jgi:hypothetical protein
LAAAFGIRHLAFGIWHSAFGIRHLEFGIWHSAFGIRRHSAFGGHSAVGIRHSAFGIFHFPPSALAADKVFRREGGEKVPGKSQLPVRLMSF